MAETYMARRHDSPAGCAALHRLPYARHQDTGTGLECGDDYESCGFEYHFCFPEWPEGPVSYCMNT
jgi:hypothetical protein